MTERHSISFTSLSTCSCCKYTLFLRRFSLVGFVCCYKDHCGLTQCEFLPCSCSCLMPLDKGTLLPVVVWTPGVLPSSMPGHLVSSSRQVRKRGGRIWEEVLGTRPLPHMSLPKPWSHGGWLSVWGWACHSGLLAWGWACSSGVLALGVRLGMSSWVLRPWAACKLQSWFYMILCEIHLSRFVFTTDLITAL